MFGWFKAKKPVVPPAEKEPARYAGRPLLIFLENYVLSCIGELSAEDDARLTQLVQRVFGGESDWKSTLRERLALNAGLDDSIRELWAKNSAIAKGHDMQLHPVQFAKMIADTNFAHLL